MADGYQKQTSTTRDVVTMLKLMADTGRRILLQPTISDDEFMQALAILERMHIAKRDMAFAMGATTRLVGQWIHGTRAQRIPKEQHVRRSMLHDAFALLQTEGIRHMGKRYHPTTGELLVP